MELELPRGTADEQGGCISCITRRLRCDARRPKCGRCTEEDFLTCSYEWTLAGVIALFPPSYNVGNAIALRSIEAINDLGGFGKVYRTSLVGRHSEVAVKVLFQRSQTPERILMLALREALTWSRLRHEHVLPLMGVADYSKICDGAPSQLCLVSPWMAAGNVMVFLSANPQTDRNRLVLDVMNAVCYLHSLSPVVIHGDLRGSNILVDVREGRPRARLTDFGLSLIREVGAAFDSTSTGRSGHPRWMSPEQLFPEKFNLRSSYLARSTASDVFAMCRTALEVLSGSHPFAGIHNDWTIVQLVDSKQQPERPAFGPQILSDVLWNALKRGWAHNPQDRPPVVELYSVFVAEMIKVDEDQQMSSLKTVIVSDLMHVLQHRYYGDDIGLAKFLDATSLMLSSREYRSFDGGVALTCIAAVSDILLSTQSLSILSSALYLLQVVEHVVEETAPTGWRSQHIHLYAGRESCLIDSALLILKSPHFLEVHSRMGLQLNTLLCNPDIGGVCRDRLITSGGLAAIRAVLETSPRTKVDGKEFFGLALMNSVTSGHTLAAHLDTFLDSGLLSALLLQGEEKACLHWDIIVPWMTLLNRCLHVLKAGDARRDVLLNEQTAGLKLLSQRRDVVVEGTHYRSVLHAAALRDDDDIATLLIDSGAYKDMSREFFSEDLHLASQDGQEKAVRLLLRAGAGVNVMDMYGNTALYIASKCGHEAIVGLLIESGANVNAPNKDGWTALHAASMNGYVAVVRLLLLKRANVHAENKDGWTPLFCASEHGGHGYENIIRLLLTYGANVNAWSAYGLTALHRASGTGSEAIIRLLLVCGADVNARDTPGRTALHYASEHRYESLVRQLIELGADVNALDMRGLSALHIASKEGHVAIVSLLLFSGADVNARDMVGWTALCLTLAFRQFSYEPMTRLLIDHGANVNDRNPHGETALHLAAKSGDAKVVQLLIDHGANVNGINLHGETALHVARQTWNAKVVQLLIRHGAM